MRRTRAALQRTSRTIGPRPLARAAPARPAAQDGLPVSSPLASCRRSVPPAARIVGDLSHAGMPNRGVNCNFGGSSKESAVANARSCPLGVLLWRPSRATEFRRHLESADCHLRVADEETAM